MKKVFAFIFAALAISASAKDVKVGDIIDIEGINYKIISLEPAQAEVTESPFAEGELEILSEFTQYGVKVQVTKIGSEAFSCKLGDERQGIYGTLTIPEGITEIGWQAFLGCNRFDSISLPSTLTKIGSSAFYCYNDKPSTLSAVRCAAVVPPTCGDMVFGTRFNPKDGVSRDIPLWVPKGSVQAYRANSAFDVFNLIIDFEMEESSTVDEEHYDPDPSQGGDEGGEGSGDGGEGGEGDHQGIDDVQGVKAQSIKRVINGELYIERNGELYTMQGQKL